jgi:hypothetical protein
MLHHDLAGLANSRVLLTVTTMLHHCNDCGAEINPGDDMAWAVAMNLPFCRGCTISRGLDLRADHTRRWRQVHP